MKLPTILLPAFLTLLLLTPGLRGQEAETPTFRAGVALVRIDVQVTQGGRQVEGLTKDDLVIADEGQPQAITYFGRQSDPLDLVLLVDVSGSMRQHIEPLATVARESLRVLQPSDRVAVMLFSRETEILQDLTSNVGDVVTAVREAASAQGLGSGTQINPALLAAARHLRDEKRAGAPANSRRAVLILTDNQSLHYQSPDDVVVKAFTEAEAVLDAIVLGKGDRPKPPRPGQYLNPDFTPADVFHIATETGGDAIKADRVANSFPAMVERIRTRYQVQYRAPEARPGAFRRVRVELSAAARTRFPKAVVRAREGYYAQ